MPDDYRASVEDLIVESVANDATRRIIEMQREDPILDRCFIEVVIRRAISGSLELAKQIAPRIGSMCFEDAMQAVVAGKPIARAGWHVDRYLCDGNGSRPPNPGGFLVGENSVHDMLGKEWEFYKPTSDDREAADWLEYRWPELPFVSLED